MGSPFLVILRSSLIFGLFIVWNAHSLRIEMLGDLLIVLKI